VDIFRELVACPACGGDLSADWRCAACGEAFAVADGIPNLRLPGDRRTEAVRTFYQQSPFPGYPRHDTLHALRARAERSAFAQLLDRAVAGDARIVEVGCGTGQMSLYLARADRRVVGADLARASLTLGAAQAARYGLERVRFVETDLQRPGLRPQSFDVVYSSGVLHHTPDPRASFARLARLARPGGIVVLGVYNALARVPTRLRRLAGRLSGFRHVPFDPVLRDRRDEPERRRAWLRDQYQHPEEHRHTLREVQRWFAENGVDYLRSYPSAVFGDEPENLFTPACDDWPLEAWLAQAGWMWTLGREGGLFFTIGRRSDNGSARNHP
jgi:SAM-dependent methyltransferase